MLSTKSLKINYFAKTALLVAGALALVGCADHVTLTNAIEISPVGFWYGLWHGLILPFAWLISLFDNDTAIYAIYNNGGWYDFGFLLGVSSSMSSTVIVKK